VPTIIGVRKNGKVVVAVDGQVVAAIAVISLNAKKVMRLGDGKVIGGSPAATADALFFFFTLFERLERSWSRNHGQLMRSRRSSSPRTGGRDTYCGIWMAMMIVRRQGRDPDPDRQWRRAGAGGRIAAIGSGGNFGPRRAATALLRLMIRNAETIARSRIRSPPTSASTTNEAASL